MGLTDLQSHILKNIPDATVVVDLLKIARERPKREGRMKLVVDGECCLDRLYGGYYPDWICGGQWDKMEQFLRNFSLVVQNSNLDLVVFFNGTLEYEHIGTGAAHRYDETYRYLEEISKHIAHKKKPPPKVWWIPPAYLRSAIRQTFRLLDMKTMCTLDDHHKDIIRFCQRNKFHGIIAENPEYLISDSYRYFSAQKLKLTFKGSLETVELKLKKVFETINVPKERISIFSALLGNHILSDEDLRGFFGSLGIENDPQSKSSVIEKVAQFTRELDTKDLEVIGGIVAKKSVKSEETAGDQDKSQVVAAKIVKCLRYYADLKAPSSASKSRAKKSKKEKQAQKNMTINNASAAAVQSPSGTDKPEEAFQSTQVSDAVKEENQDKETVASPSASSSISNKNTTLANSSDAKGTGQIKQTTATKAVYRVNPQVEDVAVTRHKAGVMSPYICQIIRQKEIRLPLLIEDIRPGSTELVRAHDLFRPLRQRVYAVLFNLHHLNFLAKQRNEKGPTIQIKETYFCTRTKTLKNQLVNAVEIGWPVPTVEKLWLGEGEDCKNKRIRAFLTMMKSEHRMMIDSEFVPQQMVILAAVLRYILQSDKKLLRKQELDAFVAQAFIQDMTDANLAQEIEVTNLTIRGVHLSHLFMEGVEMALLANDACGAPLPYMLFCPWLFFNGKIFNYVLEQQAEGRNLSEICGYKADLLYSIEQITLAVCDGVKNPFIQTMPLPFPSKGLGTGLINCLLPRGSQSRVPNVSVQNSALYDLGRHGGGNAFLAQFPAPNLIPRSRGSHPHYNAGAGHFLSNGAYQYTESLLGQGGRNFYASQGGSHGFTPRGLSSLYNNSDLLSGIPARQRRVPTRGGQLEVAGMVVGSWGANYGPTGHVAVAGLGHRMNRNSVLAARNSEIASLMHPLRISGAGASKVSSSRGGHPSGSHWSQKRGSRAGKKSIMKKPSEGSTKQGNSKGQGAANSSGSANKNKGVSFKDESNTNDSDKLESGGGDASASTVETVDLQTSEDKSPKVNGSSPPAESNKGDAFIPSKTVELEPEG